MEEEQKLYVRFVKSFLREMTDEQRLELFSDYCEHCGGDAPCRCWDDS